VFDNPRRLIITFYACTMGLATWDLLFLASRSLRCGDHMAGILALRNLGWAFIAGDSNRTQTRNQLREFNSFS
jgi:hypothetical protein